MGGMHSIYLAATHPDRVRALAIVDAGVEPMPEGRDRVQRLLTGRPRGFASSAEARAYLERTSPGYPATIYENRLAFAFREDDGGLVWRSNPAALERIMRARRPGTDRWAAVRAIRAPTVLVRGTRSNVLSAEVAERMRETLADGRLLELEAGHNVPLDRPKELAEAVVALATGRRA